MKKFINICFSVLFFCAFMTNALAESTSSISTNTRETDSRKHIVGLSTFEYDLLGIRYSYDILSQLSAGIGLGFGTGVVLTSTIDSYLIMPVTARYYFITDKHRPYMSATGYVPITGNDGVNASLGAGYEFRALNGFVARMGMNFFKPVVTKTSTSKEVKIPLTPTLNFGWSF